MKDTDLDKSGKGFTTSSMFGKKRKIHKKPTFFTTDEMDMKSTAVPINEEDDAAAPDGEKTEPEGEIVLDLDIDGDDEEEDDE